MAMSRLIRRRLHRDEKMRKKYRVTLFVCTNDDGSHNVTLSLSELYSQGAQMFLQTKKCL
jgi:hypothetical protein